MKFCPRCGSELAVASNLCPACGYNLSVFQEETDNSQQVTDQPEQPGVIPDNQYFFDSIENEKRSKPIFLDLFYRSLYILIQPKKEWLVIENEQPNKIKLLTRYVLILALIPFILDFISFGLIKSDYSISFAIVNSILGFLISVLVIYLLTYISEYLAPSFFAPKDFNKSFQLVCYSFTPVWIASILTMITGLHLISLFLGFAYMAYLLRTGIPVIKKAPDDKALGYSILMVLSAYLSYMISLKVLEYLIL